MEKNSTIITAEGYQYYNALTSSITKYLKCYQNINSYDDIKENKECQNMIKEVLIFENLLNINQNGVINNKILNENISSFDEHLPEENPNYTLKSLVEEFYKNNFITLK